MTTQNIYSYSTDKKIFFIKLKTDKGHNVVVSKVETMIEGGVGQVAPGAVFISF